MSDRSRQTSNVIKKLTAYFNQSTPPAGVDEKLGDIWFNETTRGVVGSGKPLSSMQKVVSKRKKEKAERPPVKIPKLKKKRSL